MEENKTENTTENQAKTTDENVAAAPAKASTNETDVVKISYAGAELEIPPQYYDKEKNEVKIDALIKSNLDMRKQISAKPKAPEKYDFTLPEEHKNFVIDAEDPLAKSVVEMGKKYGITQEDLNVLVSNYVGSSPYLTAFKEEPEKFQKEFGKEYKKDIAEATTWLTELTGAADEEGKIEIQSMLATARGLKLVKALQEAIKTPNIPRVSEAAPAQLSREDLRELMRSEAYKKGNPEMLRKVDEGYKQLVGNGG